MFPTHSVVMLSFIILSIFQLSPVMMNVECLNGVFHQADFARLIVVMLCVIMLIAVAPQR